MNLTNIKQIFRHLYRKKLYTSINILGLGIGLGCVILMATYIIHEFSFDRYHSKSSRIYRLVNGKNCGTFYAMGEAFKKDIPEIEDAFSVFPIYDFHVKQKQQFIKEKDVFLSDASILNVLDIEFITGDKKNQLIEPNTLIISEKIAQKYFHGLNPVGEFIQVAISNKIYNLKVTGVYKNFPSNSSIKADFIGDISLSFSLLWDIMYTIGQRANKPAIDYRHEWNRNEFRTFILLHKDANIELTEKKCTEICLTHKYENENGGIHLQPLSQMYLHSNNLEDTEPFQISQMDSLRIFAGIGFLILMVALVNFIFISNADSVASIKEIACRKVNGASKTQIILRTLYKSLIISFLSLIPALLFVSMAIPFFNEHFQKDLRMELFMELPYISALLILVLLTGLSSGLYLGMITSNVNPTKLFQKALNPDKRKLWKGSMVIVQFAVFILLSTCVIIMKKQFNYALHKDLGLNTNNIMVVDLNAEEFKSKMASIKNEIMLNSNVVGCSPTSFTIPPSDNFLDFSYKDNNQSKTQEALVFGPGVLELLKINLIEGISFNETNAKNRDNLIINEAAAKKYKVKVGDKIVHFNVIGIVKNFHYHSIHQPVNPIFIVPQSQNFSFLLIKTNGNNKLVAENLKQICSGIAPNILFQYEMLNDRVAKFYEKEKNQMGMIGFFSIVALSLSIMGLFGFVSLNLSKRTKEIGIRKINGAKSIELIKMLNLQYLKWVFVAFIIASPIAYYVLTKWLENFAYKTDLSLWVFASAGIVAQLIAFLTVSWQSWRASIKNPVEALKYE